MTTHDSLLQDPLPWPSQTYTRATIMHNSKSQDPAYLRAFSSVLPKPTQSDSLSPCIVDFYDPLGTWDPLYYWWEHMSFSKPTTLDYLHSLLHNNAPRDTRMYNFGTSFFFVTSLRVWGRHPPPQTPPTTVVRGLVWFVCIWRVCLSVPFVCSQVAYFDDNAFLERW